MTRFQIVRTATLSTLTTCATLAAIGALALSGAVTQARATPSPRPPSSLTEWHSMVEKAVARKMTVPDNLDYGDLRIMQIGVDFDAAGKAIGSHVVKGSGLASMDIEGKRIARTIDYPRLPTPLQGRPHTVIVELYFATPQTMDAAQAAIAHRQAQADAAIRKLESNVQQASSMAVRPIG